MNQDKTSSPLSIIPCLSQSNELVSFDIHSYSICQSLSYPLSPPYENVFPYTFIPTFPSLISLFFPLYARLVQTTIIMAFMSTAGSSNILSSGAPRPLPLIFIILDTNFSRKLQHMRKCQYCAKMAVGPLSNVIRISHVFLDIKLGFIARCTLQAISINIMDQFTIIC